MNSNQIYIPAREFISMYEKMHGGELCAEYWALRNALDAIYKKRVVVEAKPKKRQTDRQKLLRDNIRLTQMLFSCWLPYYEQKNETCIIAKVKSPYDKIGPKQPITVMVSYKEDGSIYRISFRPNLYAVERRQIIKLIKNPLTWH
jgi:hypothetical protein